MTDEEGIRPLRAREMWNASAGAAAAASSTRNRCIVLRTEPLDAGLALRTLATYVKQHGPFDGAIGFSQGANTLALWLSLIEAGVLPYEWAAPKWACLICATQWGWAARRHPS